MPDNYTPAMPEQIRKQVEEAERLRSQMQPQPENQPAQDENDEEGEEEGEGEGGQQFEDEEGQSWEQRFKSTQGRYEQLMRSNQALQERVAELQRGAAQSKIKPTAAPSPQSREFKKLVTSEEENEYGKDFFDVVGRRAKETIAPDLTEFDDRIKRLEGRQDAVHTVIETTAKQGMIQILNQAVPNWRQINVHPDFKAWASQLDPYSGRPLKDMLLEAFNRQEARRVVSFFQGFLAEAADLPQNAPGNGQSAPPLASPSNGQGNGSGKPSLADFAAPGRARSAPQTLPPDKPMYTQAQVARLSDEKRRGLWKGREAQLDAIEVDIFKAQHEGRLLP